MTTSPSGSPNSCCSESSACRAIAISVSAAPFCSSSGVVSYQRNGARSMLPHLLRTTASSRSRTSLAPSAAISSTPHCRFTAWPRKGCPVPSAAARSNTTKVLPAPHWPDSRPCPTAGISCLDQPRLERPRVCVPVCI